jgi:hypothetical protein
LSPVTATDREGCPTDTERKKNAAGEQAAHLFLMTAQPTNRPSIAPVTPRNKNILAELLPETAVMRVSRFEEVA